MSDEQTSANEEEYISKNQLLEEIQVLKRSIASLTGGKDYDPETEPECIKWDLYEQAIGNDPVSFIKAHMDIVESPVDYLRRKTVKELSGCLRFFTGETQGLKKSAFMDFLRKYPGYRSKNIRLIEQRLYITRKWMKENNFASHKLEDLYDILNPKLAE